MATNPEQAGRQLLRTKPPPLVQVLSLSALSLECQTMITSCNQPYRSATIKINLNLKTALLCLAAADCLD